MDFDEKDIILSPEIENKYDIRDEEDKDDRKNIWDKYERIPQPENIKIKLFPHQLVTVYNMELLERIRRVNILYNNNSVYVTDFGILGDIPGYGKSFIFIFSG